MNTRWMSLRRQSSVIGVRVKFATKVPRRSLRHIAALKKTRWSTSASCQSRLSQNVLSCNGDDDYSQKFVVFNCNLNASKKPKADKEQCYLLRKRKPHSQAQVVTRSVKDDRQKETQKLESLSKRQKISVKRKKIRMRKSFKNSPQQNEDEKFPFGTTGERNNLQPPENKGKTLQESKNRTKKKVDVSDPVVIKRRQRSQSVKPKSTKASGLEQPSLTPKIASVISTCNQDITDWPNLSDVHKRKGSAKDIAKELVKTKRSGSVTKMTQRRWADIVRPRSKELGNPPPNVIDSYSRVEKMTSSNNPPIQREKTWANVAAASVTNRCLNPSSDYKQTISTDCPNVAKNFFSSKSKRRKRALPKNLVERQTLSPKILKCKGKPQSLSFYRKLASETSSKKKTKKSMKNKRRSSCITRPDMCQKRLYKTSETDHTERTDEHQRLCIDNMPFVYIKPVSSIVVLNEPLQQERNHSDNGKRNPLSSRESQKGYLTSNKISTLQEVNDKLEKESSEPDICSRLDCLTFPVSKGTGVDDHVSVALDGNCATCSKQLPLETGEEDGQKKVSLSYRALLRETDGRLNSKLISERQTRNRKIEAIQEGKTKLKEKLKLQRIERKQRVHSEQRSMLLQPSHKNTTLTLQGADVQGTSRDFMTFSTDNQDDHSQPRVHCTFGNNASTDDKDVNNSFDYDTWSERTSATTKYQPRASDANAQLDGNAEKCVQLGKNLLTEDTLLDHIESLDVDWWCSYLFKDLRRTSVCQEQ